MKQKILFKNIREILTLSGVSKKDGRKILEADLGIIADATMVVEEGRLVWLGAAEKSSD